MQFRVVLCGTSHFDLADEDGVVSGPLMSPQPPLPAAPSLAVLEHWNQVAHRLCCVRGCWLRAETTEMAHRVCVMHRETFSGIARPLVDDFGKALTMPEAAAVWGYAQELRFRAMHDATRGRALDMDYVLQNDSEREVREVLDELVDCNYLRQDALGAFRASRDLWEALTADGAPEVIWRLNWMLSESRLRRWPSAR